MESQNFAITTVKLKHLEHIKKRINEDKEWFSEFHKKGIEARRRWGVERYEVKSKIATLMGKETNYEWRKVKEQK